MLISRVRSVGVGNALADGAGSSREGLLFCNLEYPLLVGSCDVEVVGMMDRFGNRVVGTASSTLLGGIYCDL